MVTHMCYSTFKVQEYFKKKHKMKNHEVSLMFALCSRSAQSFTANSLFNSEKMCLICEKENNSQEHCLKCEITYPISTRNIEIQYSDIFSGDLTKQAAIAELFATVKGRREVASDLSTGPSNCQGFPVQCHSSVNCTNCAIY